MVLGGESGIRTHETPTGLRTFQARAFNHSAISPHLVNPRGYLYVPVPEAQRNREMAIRIGNPSPRISGPQASAIHDQLHGPHDLFRFDNFVVYVSRNIFAAGWLGSGTHSSSGG